MRVAQRVSEALLYLITCASAPWLLRQGQHIRVDILLRRYRRVRRGTSSGSPTCWAWPAALVIAWYGVDATVDAYKSGEMFIKAVATPVWWWLALLPVTFVMLRSSSCFACGGSRSARSRAATEEAVCCGMRGL